MSRKDEPPPTGREALEGAARAVGKIDRYGQRGLTLVTLREIEAMALALVAFGLIAVYPGDTVPERLIVARRVDG